MVFTILFSSCAAIGTKTLYRTNETFNIEKIGFNNLYGDNLVNEIFPQTEDIFASSVLLTLREYGFIDPQKTEIDISFDHPDQDQIEELCNKHNLDGLLISKLEFIHVTYSFYSAPVAQNYDTEVQMKLFDKNGKLLITTRHNTLKGNSYMMPPSADRTIRDGAKGALKRITKEMGLEKAAPSNQ